MATARDAIAALVQMERTPKKVVRQSEQQPVKADKVMEADAIPYLPENLSVMELEIDYRNLIESLKNKTDLSRVPLRQVTVIFAPTGDRKIQVWQLPPLSVMLLRLCDGRRTVGAIVREFSLLETGFDGIPADKVCLFGLMQLRKDGFISLSDSPVMREREAGSSVGEITGEPKYSLPPQATNTQQPWPPLGAVENLSGTD
jgi:hypothetical protein